MMNTKNWMIGVATAKHFLADGLCACSLYLMAGPFDGLLSLAVLTAVGMAYCPRVCVMFLTIICLLSAVCLIFSQPRVSRMERIMQNGYLVEFYESFALRHSGLA